MKNILLIVMLLLISCKNEPDRVVEEVPTVEKKIFTEYSKTQSGYLNFNSRDAINRIADIENEYFQNIEDGVSKYYGTEWKKVAEQIMINDSTSQYQDYLTKLEEVKSDSLHCTIYAYEGLKAGLTNEQLEELEQIHRDIWKSREKAGWSIGFILVKYFNWTAYLFLDPNSNEYQHCLKAYARNKSYPVWRQPDIPLENVYIIGEQDSLINNLLLQHEFSWGFSEQGIHTWITRYDKLKECNWYGAPSKQYEEGVYIKPLFITTSFEDYFDYNSHVVVIPPKKEGS